MVVENQIPAQVDALIDPEYDFKIQNRKIKGKTQKDKMKLHDAKINLNLFYRFSAALQREALRHLPKKKSFLFFRSIAYLMGYFISKSTRKKLSKIWAFFYPPTYRKYFSKWATRLSAALIEFFFELTFIMPGRVKSKSNSDLSWEGIEYLQNELKKGKGVIVTSLHMGHFLHPAKIILDSTYEINGKRLPMFLGILSSAENEFLVREQAEKYANLDVIITDNFNNLKEGIENHLKKNHVVFVIQDFCNSKQLRVPFIHGMKKYDFLMPCPQLLSYFHYKMGSPVIYCVNIPDGDLSKTHTIYFPPINLYRDPQTEPDEPMRKELIRFQNNEMEEYERFGLISTEINRALNPYILQYPFFWEEVYPFWKRSSYFIDISDAHSVGNAIEIISDAMIAFLNNSFEPGRNTKQLASLFEKLKNESLVLKCKAIENMKNQKSYDLGRMNTSEMLEAVKTIIETIFDDCQIEAEQKSPILKILNELK